MTTKPRTNRSGASGTGPAVGDRGKTQGSKRTAGRTACAAVIALMLVPASTLAQSSAASLTLEEAIDLARRNNPVYRSQTNDAAVADWGVRAAYGSFLPSLSVSSGMSYQAAGPLRFSGAITGADLGITQTPAYYSSRYGISFGLSLSGATFFELSQARAQRDATDARISAAAHGLEADVTRQYLATLRARDAMAIAASALESADRALQLAEVRHQLGAVARVDVSQAQIDRGRAEVGVLRAENDYEMQKLRLLELLGVQLEAGFEPTSRFAVFEPMWTVEALTAQALSSHPQLASVRAAESAARASSRAAKMSYLPSLSIGGGWSGFVRKTGSDAYLLAQARSRAESSMENCEARNDLSSRLANPYPTEDCSLYAFTSADEAAVLRGNEGFPFDYETDPLSMSVSISLPIMNGFARERQVQTARIAAQDAAEQTRAEELRRRTEVATNLLTLRTSYRAVMLEERNAAASSEQLELAQERYRLGAGSILEVTQAQEQKTRADQAHLDAVYTFHEALAALEVAVGASLRDVGG